MKRIFSISLLALFLFNLFGVYITLDFMQYDNKEKMATEIKNNFSKSQLDVIRISEDDLQKNTANFQLSGEHEIRYYGNMYDVVKEKKENGFVYFYCIKDVREDTLNKALNTQISMNILTDSNKTNNNAKELVKAFSKDYFPTFNQLTVFRNSENRLFPSIFLNYENICEDILSPPPKIG